MAIVIFSYCESIRRSRTKRPFLAVLVIATPRQSDVFLNNLIIGDYEQ